MFWTVFFAVLCAFVVWDLVEDLVNDSLRYLGAVVMLPFVWFWKRISGRTAQ